MQEGRKEGALKGNDRKERRRQVNRGVEEDKKGKRKIISFKIKDWKKTGHWRMTMRSRDSERDWT